MQYGNLRVFPDVSPAATEEACLESRRDEGAVMGVLGLALALWVLTSVVVSLLLGATVRVSRGRAVPAPGPVDCSPWPAASPAVSLGSA